MKVISSIEEVRKYISLTATFKFDRIVQHIDNYVNMGLMKLLGKEFLKELSDGYEKAMDDFSALSSEEKKNILESGGIFRLMDEKYWQVMYFIQNAVSNIAFMNSMSQQQLSISESGVRLNVNENQKTAFQWQIDDLKFQLATDGYGALNSLLEYLEANVNDFEKWKTSDSYFEQKLYFVESAELFNKAYYISNNRMTYLTLRYIMQRIELFEVKRILTPKVFEALKEAQSAEYSNKQKVLIDSFLIPGIVLLTVAKGIIERAIEVSDIGVQANLYTYYASLKSTRKKYGNESDRDKMVEQLTADGNEFLQEARKYVESNEDEFGELPDQDSPMNFRVINKPERKIFGM